MPPVAYNYTIAFLMTIMLETVVAWLLGYRRRQELACVVAVNVFSHPLLNFFVWIAATWLLSPFDFLEMLLLEAGVVTVEWRLMCFALPHHSRTGLFFLSLVMNGVSYTAGYFVPWR